MDRKGTIHQIAVDGLSQGTYALRVLTGDGPIVKRFIKR